MTVNIMVSYRLKKNKVDEVKKAIAEFIKAIKENEPKTLVYEAFQHDDRITFTHIMSFANEEARKLHENSIHVKKFVQILYPNCKVEPLFTNLNVVV